MSTFRGNPDYVFDKDYQRMTPLEKEIFYDEFGHLHGLESAEDMEKNGMDGVETIKGITMNVEENSLDIIDLYKRVLKLEEEKAALEEKIHILEQR